MKASQIIVGLSLTLSLSTLTASCFAWSKDSSELKTIEKDSREINVTTNRILGQIEMLNHKAVSDSRSKEEFYMDAKKHLQVLNEKADELHRNIQLLLEDMNKQLKNQ